MTPAYVIENEKERERLRAMVDRLREEELRLPLGEDWTVAVALAHLAFWDQRTTGLLRRWKANGMIETSPIDIDLTNEALLPTWQALAPRAAADLAVSAAEAVDREAETTPLDLAARIEGGGERSRLYRSVHRKMHLDQIDRRLRDAAQAERKE